MYLYLQTMNWYVYFTLQIRMEPLFWFQWQMCISGTKMNRFWFWTGSILTPFHLFSRSFDRERSLARMVGNKLSLHGPARIVGLSFAAKILLSVWSHIHTNRHEHRHNRAKIFYARIIALPYETNIEPPPTGSMSITCPRLRMLA